ncbi:hypothetical protein V865_004468 [Kwoniella europaea PYCC6329]|uniref:F-box domain-containing protein n=1 Tax=Kwoniella europaea PYCC6329 TaxID=1423913 RepID=A0AAX4KKM2_9TREE
MTNPQIDISFARLQPVHYLIYHYLKTDHSRALLTVTKKLYQELVPIVYRRIKLRPGGLYTLFRYLVVNNKDSQPSGTDETILNERVVKALNYTSHLEISDIEQCEELQAVIAKWITHTDELIYPNLEHLPLGENVIIESFSPTDEGGIYTLQPKFNILTSILKLSSPTTLCIDWPETYGKERSSDPFEGGSLIDWFVPELLHNLDEDTCSIKEIKIHRPKIKLDMVNPPEIPLEGILNNVFWSVVNAMDALIEEDIHFDWTMIGEPFSFNFVDNGKIQEAIDTVAEDVWDDYENLYDTVKDAITWKKQYNENEWKCRCGKHVPNWKVISKRKSPTPDVEVVDHTQRKIDEYFKPMKKDS